VTTIRTPRLVLQTLTSEEAAAIRSGDREGRRWAADYPTDGEAVVAGVIGEAGEHYDERTDLGILQIRLRDTGTAVGGIGFLWAPSPDGEVEVGYGLAESAQGQGLATEALKGVIEHARHRGVRSIMALTDPDNRASQRVLEHCGFERDVEMTVTDDGPMLRWTLSLALVTFDDDPSEH
jgi:RimJ/RimL family protein N-acetyltransferase